MSKQFREVLAIMSETLLSDGWIPVSAAPHDGTPVILWLEEDEMPPVFPQPVGFWTVNSHAEVGYWRLFGDPPRVCSDRQIRGWRPCLRK